MFFDYTSLLDTLPAAQRKAGSVFDILLCIINRITNVEYGTLNIEFKKPCFLIRSTLFYA